MFLEWNVHLRPRRHYCQLSLLKDLRSNRPKVAKCAWDGIPTRRPHALTPSRPYALTPSHPHALAPSRPHYTYLWFWLCRTGTYHASHNNLTPQTARSVHFATEAAEAFVETEPSLSSWLQATLVVNIFDNKEGMQCAEPGFRFLRRYRMAFCVCTGHGRGPDTYHSCM